jgi:putative Mg2+ transporter-C (MgtC) family protein
MMQGLLERVVDVLRLDLALQLGLATLLGGVVGLERELSGKPAGLRTNILICMGSVLFTALSMTMGGPAADPTRVAAQIVTGVGFIGAGTILHARGQVVGLTSAATIWVVAAIGVALGAGLYLEALGTTVLVVLVLHGLGWIEKLVERHSTTGRVTVHAHARPGVPEEIETVVRRTGVEIIRAHQRHEAVDLVVEFELRGPKRLHDEAMVALLRLPGVRTVATGE